MSIDGHQINMNKSSNFLSSLNYYFNKYSTTFIFVIMLCIGTWQVTRMFYGVDFTDDIFILTMSLNIIKGQFPFIDEVNLLCLTSLFLTPFYWLWYNLFDVEGIVLFSRILFLIAKMSLCYVFYVYFKNLLPKVTIFIVFSLIITVSTYGLPSISYNNLPGILLAISWIVLFGYMSDEKMRKKLYAVGIFGLLAGTSIIMYPPLFVVYALSAVLLISLKKLPFTVKEWIYIFLGGIIPCIYFFGYIFYYKITIYHFIEAVSHYESLNLSKKFNFIKMPFSLLKKSWIIIFLLYAVYLLRKKYTSISIMLLISLPFLICYRFYSSEIANIPWMYLPWAFLGWVFYLLMPKSSYRHNIFYYIWVPSFIAAMTISAYTSNGTPGTVFGIFPAWIISSILYIDYVFLISQETKYGVSAVALSRYGLIFMIILMNINLLNFYRDDSFNDLNNRVMSGPYKWISTSSSKINFLETIDKSLQKIEKSGCTIAFYDAFPAGYLLSKCKKCAPTIWIFHTEDYTHQIEKKWILAYYESKGMLPEYVYRLKRPINSKNEVYELTYPASDDYNTLIERKFDIVENNQYYDLFALKY